MEYFNGQGGGKTKIILNRACDVWLVFYSDYLLSSIQYIIIYNNNL